MSDAPHSKKFKLSGVTPSIATLWAKKPNTVSSVQAPEYVDHQQQTPSSAQENVAVPYVELVESSSVRVDRAATNHSVWALTRPWIEHRPETDDFRCVPCMWALENNMIPGFVDKSRIIGIKLVTTGWSDYRVGVQALDKHAKGDAHKGCMMAWQTFQTKAMTEAYIKSEAECAAQCEEVYRVDFRLCTLLGRTRSTSPRPQPQRRKFHTTCGPHAFAGLQA